MVTAIIVDDEILLLKSLEQLIKKYCPKIAVIAACNASVDAIEKVDTLKPQLLFLDINMPYKTGFELLQEIIHKNVEIIFVTAHNNYMQKAFQFSAIDYLLKPIDEDELILAVNRAIDKIEHKVANNNIETFFYNIKHQQTAPHQMKLCLPTNNGFNVVDVKDIIVCNADGPYTEFVFTNGKKFIVSKPLIEYDGLLEEQQFVRIHKSHLVNINHIVQYSKGEGGSVSLTNGMELEVSRRRKDVFLNVMKTVFKY